MWFGVGEGGGRGGGGVNGRTHCNTHSSLLGDGLVMEFLSTLALAPKDRGTPLGGAPIPCIIPSRHICAWHVCVYVCMCL